MRMGVTAPRAAGASTRALRLCSRAALLLAGVAAATEEGRQLQEAEPCEGGVTLTDGGDVFQPQYGNNQDCTWLLTCSDSSLAPQMTFTEFHTEGDWDFVYVYDGAAASSHIAVTLHGNLGSSVEPITGSSSSVLLRLVTDGTVLAGGFTGSYTCEDAVPRAPPDPCDGDPVIATDGGEFFHSTLSADQECKWQLVCSDNTLSPRIIWTAFDLENANDHVYLQQGPVNILQWLNNPAAPDTATTSRTGARTPDVWTDMYHDPCCDSSTGVLYRSDGVVDGQGFAASWECVDNRIPYVAPGQPRQGSTEYEAGDLEWSLAMNINPADGHNFGWGEVGGDRGWPVDASAAVTTACPSTLEYSISQDAQWGSNPLATYELMTDGQAFSGSAWGSGTTGQATWLQAEYAEPVKINTVFISSGNAASWGGCDGYRTTMVIKASDDGVTFTAVETIAAPDAGDIPPQARAIPETTARFFRISPSSGWGCLGEFRLECDGCTCPGDAFDGDHVGVGADVSAFTADYLDKVVWNTDATFISIVRHTDGVCTAAKVWRFAETGHSLGDYFDEANPLASRTTVTTGGELFSEGIDVQDSDPIFSPSLSGSDLIFNFFYGAFCMSVEPLSARLWLCVAELCLIVPL